MKKLMALSLAMLMTLSLAACGSGSSDISEDGTFTPTKTITWTCTSSAGGGSDIFSRKISEIMTNEDMVRPSWSPTRPTVPARWAATRSPP